MDLLQGIHDARRPLNNISMQAELIKMLVEGSEHDAAVTEAANKIIQYCQDCSESLQEISQSSGDKT
ncbi:histidine kinase [Glaciecola siphonariae]|uniref:Histidine kinase n=1 Tax=Glaciecola siphonariae TaxID=521012 RepID=A0ABV9LWU4_9ALTE